MPVLSSLSGREVNDIAQAAVGPRRCPPKAEATGSNPVGLAIAFNYLAVAGRASPRGLVRTLPALPVRYPFRPRPFGSVGFNAARLRGVYKGRPPSIDAAKVAALKAEGLGATGDRQASQGRAGFCLSPAGVVNVDRGYI